jgi:phage terminase large subunit
MLMLDTARSTLFRWRIDPDSFVREAFGATPEKWQSEVLSAIAVHDRISIRSGHGVGKSTLLSWVILWWILTRYPTKAACTAPTSHQLNDVLWSELAFWRRKLPPGLQDQLVLKADRLELVAAPRESFAVARTSRAESPESLQGFHSEFMLYIVDEASIIPDIVFEVARGALTSPGSKTLMCGNPNRAEGYFYQSFQPGSPFVTFHVPCSESSRVDPAFIEDMRRDYGEASNIFRVRVAGEFPLQGDDVLIGIDLIEEAVERFKEVFVPEQRLMEDGFALHAAPKRLGKPPVATPLAIRKKSRIWPIVWGIDIARYGSDKTVLVERRGPIVPTVISWTQLSNMEIAGRIVRMFENCDDEDKPETIYCDSLGTGSGVLDRLLELDLPAVGVNVTELPSIAGEGWKLKDELWLRARDFFLLKDAAIIDHPDLIKDLSSMTYRFHSDGRYKMEGKELIRKRLGRSSDWGDAFCLTFADGPVSLLSPISTRKGSSNWGKQPRIDTSWVA